MKLSEFEISVIQLFWQHHTATAPEIHTIISESKDVTYSTVKTIIDRLEKKSAIHRVKQEGRTIHYAPSVAADVLQKPLLSDFVDNVFGGDKKALLNHLIKPETLSQEDIDFLQNIINSSAKKND